MAILVRRDQKVYQVNQEEKGRRVSQGCQEIKDLKEIRVPQGHQVLAARVEIKDSLEMKDPQV